MSKRRTPEEILANMPKIPDSFTPEQRAKAERKLEVIKNLAEFNIRLRGYGNGNSRSI
jgi:hypothetical protein